MVKVKSFKLIYDNLGLDYIKCQLNNNKLFDIQIDDFFYFLLEKDKNLEEYSKKFITWDEFTNDLISLEFPFIMYFENYINSQFTVEELIEFTYSEI